MSCILSDGDSMQISGPKSQGQETRVSVRLPASSHVPPIDAFTQGTVTRSPIANGASDANLYFMSTPFGCVVRN